MLSCTNLPFSDLGFVPHDENLWVKYTGGKISVPYFAITTTINPTSMTFVVKDLLNNQMISTNSYEKIKEFVISTEREDRLKKLLD
jgi:hypothetical protein